MNNLVDEHGRKVSIVADRVEVLDSGELVFRLVARDYVDVASWDAERKVWVVRRTVEPSDE